MPRLSGKRIALYFLGAIALTIVAYLYFPRGSQITDGKYDLGHNGIWLQHGWIGDDSWFKKYNKLDKISWFRNSKNILNLKGLLSSHHIEYVYPHLCPSDVLGNISSVDYENTERFLEIFSGFKVLPWIGGVLGKNAFPDDKEWRQRFISSTMSLLERHPGFAGVHVNIEPCPSGNQGFVRLLIELGEVIPKDKILSVAAYPPPTFWHQYKSVHWDEKYFRLVSQLAHQMVIMMYDTALKFRMLYRDLVSSWTEEVLTWSGNTDVLLGIPAYDDHGVGYHHPEVENIPEAIIGINTGLKGFQNLPDNYKGVAIYSEWVMSDKKWRIFREMFLK
jgi:hypothetical protein